MWLKNRFVQKLGGGWLESFGLRTWSKLQFASLSARKDPAVIKLMKGIHRDKRSLMSAFAVTCPHVFCFDLARGTRSARPVRRQATSSRLSAPRWTSKASPQYLWQKAWVICAFTLSVTPPPSISLMRLLT